MISLTPAEEREFVWAQQTVAERHYLRKAVDPRCRSFAYVVKADFEAVGCLIFGRPQSTKCYVGGFTFGSSKDVSAGRAAFDRWEVLSLARVWLSPLIQARGSLCVPEKVPGFIDRGGTWRPAAASWAIRQAVARVGFDYLMAHPPCFVDEPYAIRAVLSYCDTRVHQGTIYRASGFTLARSNGDGIETWWTRAVTPLTPEQDRQVRERAARDQRAIRVRGKRMILPQLFAEQKGAA